MPIEPRFPSDHKYSGPIRNRDLRESSSNMCTLGRHTFKDTEKFVHLNF